MRSTEHYHDDHDHVVSVIPHNKYQRNGGSIKLSTLIVKSLNWKPGSEVAIMPARYSRTLLGDDGDLLAFSAKYALGYREEHSAIVKLRRVHPRLQSLALYIPGPRFKVRAGTKFRLKIVSDNGVPSLYLEVVKDGIENNGEQNEVQV